MSAIIPAYNRAAFLPETIGCLLAQTTPPHEIIVVDDGSRDETEAVVAAFGSAVRYVRIENGGAPVARNVGVSMATGDWLWFCDSDDLWRPEYLERCRDIAATAPYPQYVFGDFRLVKDGVWEPTTKFSTAPPGFWEGVKRTPAPGGAIILEPLYGAILSFQPIFPSTIVMTRALFDSVGGFDPAFARTGSEDFEFTLRCVAHAPLGMVEDALVGIRRHDSNFSSDQLRLLLGEVDILRHAKARHPAAPAVAPLIDAEITQRTLQALEQAFSAGDYVCVSALARTVEPARVDLKSRIKILLAGLPAPVRRPLVACTRAYGAGRAAA